MTDAKKYTLAEAREIIYQEALAYLKTFRVVQWRYALDLVRRGAPKYDRRAEVRPPPEAYPF